MRNTSLLAIVGAVLIATAAPTHAQSCDQQDTILKCWHRFMPAEPTVDATEVRQALNQIETGADAGPGTASSLKNFLPLLRIAGLASSGDSQAGKGLVTVDLNFLFPGLRDNGQLQAVLNTDPKIYEPVAAALKTFDPNTDPEKQLGRSVKDADDYSLVFTYGLASKTRGRNLEQHRTRFDNLFQAAIASADRTAGADLFGEAVTTLQGDALDGLTDDQQANLQDVTFAEIPNATKRVAVMHVFERLAADSAKTEKSVRENATAVGMWDFAKLLSNQPQLHTSVRRDSRESFVGADAMTVELTYELGFVNLNSFDEETGNTCAEADKLGADITRVRACGTAIRNYVNRSDIRARLEHGDRVSFSLAYSKVDDLNVALPNSAFRFHADGTKKVTAKFAYGRLFGLKGGVADTRLDVEGKYEDVSDDATRNDRFVTTMTVTKKVGNLSIPFSLVYSNKSEFVVQPDAKLGAHIGIIFNTFGDPK